VVPIRVFLCGDDSVMRLNLGTVLICEYFQLLFIGFVNKS
jgi:hypothetical protein